MKVRNPFCSQSDGFLHVGGARTALCALAVCPSTPELGSAHRDTSGALYSGGDRRHHRRDELAGLSREEGPYLSELNTSFRSLQRRHRRGYWPMVVPTSATAPVSAWMRCGKVRWRRARSRVMTDDCAAPAAGLSCRVSTSFASVILGW